MRKILNPFTKIDGYNCFGCKPNSSLGLEMQFYEDGEYIISEWEPKIHFQGYKNVLHGGIQTTLMDEIASWLVYIKIKTAGMTMKIETKYKKPVYVNKGKLLIKAKLIKRKKKVAIIDIGLYNSESELCSKSTAHYYLFPKDYAEKELFYPQYNDFFKKSLTEE